MKPLKPDSSIQNAVHVAILIVAVSVQSLLRSGAIGNVMSVTEL